MKNIFITGATGHLGQEVVTRFSETGYRVIGAVRKETSLSANVQYTAVDLTDEDAVLKLVERIARQHTRIHAAALLAGGFEMGNIAAADYASIERMLDINFKTAYTCVRPLVQHMAAQGGGVIILIASRPAVEPAKGAFATAYTLSKSLLMTLAEIINAEWNSKNVVVHVIAPGTIDTDINRKAMPAADTRTWVKAEILAEKMVELCEHPMNAPTLHKFY